MSRRASLPGASELFRTTSPGTPPGDTDAFGMPIARPEQAQPGDPDAADRARSSGSGSGRPTRDDSGHADDDGGDLAVVAPTASQGATAEPGLSRRPAVRRRPHPVGDRRPSGRERHEEKITVYVSADELLGLEHARLTLRAEHGLAVDRGRIIREAVGVVLADLDAKGEASTLVRRLLGR